MEAEALLLEGRARARRVGVRGGAALRQGDPL